MKLVWVLYYSDYGDYEIIGIFSTQEKAEEALRAMPKQVGYDKSYKMRCSILDYELDPKLKY